MIQTNLNHARHAQQLLHQSAVEQGIGLAIIAEPYSVPRNDPYWFGSNNGKAACFWRPLPNEIPCVMYKAGNEYVAVKWGDIAVISVYLSPKINRQEFEEKLEEIERCVRTLSPMPIMIAGDFNSKSTLWGSKSTNLKGKILEDWAVAMGLCCQNIGNKSTFVGPQGESVIDITWTSPSLAKRIKNWSVCSNVETLSDHAYISITVEIPIGKKNYPADRSERPKRWALSKLDEDKFKAFLMIADWSPNLIGQSLEEQIERLMKVIREACNFSMPKCSPKPSRAVFWWTEDVADARRTATSKRRIWKRKRNTTQEATAREEYVAAKNQYCAAINKAKATSWEELISTLNRDPWGRPYKIVRKKLRKWMPPKTEMLEPMFLHETINSLFPAEEKRDTQPDIENMATNEGDDVPQVSEQEIADAIKTMKSRNAAPGPDQIPGKILAMAYEVIGHEMRNTLTRCLKEGVFPSRWKKANLVLLQKDGKNPDIPSSYRPICLLDEFGKILERILATRISRFMAESGRDLHPCQYGFRKGKSTIDACLRVKTEAQHSLSEGKVMIAISLDISNAFNSLSWEAIMKAVERQRLPRYMRRILGNYLSNRWISFRNKNKEKVEMRISRGVPQGSVLGPLLWDLGYNRVLTDVSLPPCCTMVCYADDTILLTSGENWAEVRSRADDALWGIVDAIKKLTLKISPKKTEAMGIWRGRNPPPPSLQVTIDGTKIPVGNHIKYLGLVLDGQLNFVEHFRKITPKLAIAANQMGQLLPNLGGPGGHVRRLYATALHSIALYGSPVWTEEALRTKKITTYLRTAQRNLAIRAIRAYRTVSFTAATLLAGFAPLELLAARNAEVYFNIKKLRERFGYDLTNRAVDQVKRRANAQMGENWNRWLTSLGHMDSGLRVRAAIQPLLTEWLNRKKGELSFRMTQICTGHGCFGAFLHRIGKENSPRCYHCDSAEDDAQHTLEQCGAWAQQRRRLTEVLGEDLCLRTVVGSILESTTKWDAFFIFCETVMHEKEKAERERRGEGPPQEDGRIRRGRRRPRPRVVPGLQDVG